MAEKTRRVVTVARSGHVQVRTEPMPEAAPGRLLVRVKASLISPGTELGAWTGKTRPDTPEGPYRAFGYQNAGEVTGLGEGCTGFEIGQRVACMGAGYAQHADYASVPQRMATPLPDSVSDEEGAFAALAPTAMHAARRGEVAFGEDVAIIGPGVVGQLTAQVCKIAGARVAAFDPHTARVERARRCGIDGAGPEVGEPAVARVARTTGGRGLDSAFICFGGEATAALQSAVKMMQEAPDTHKMGRIVLVGGATITHGFGAGLGNLDLRSAARTGPGYHDEAYEHGADYPEVFVRWTTQAHLRLFTRWVAEGVLNVRDLITARFSLDEADQACYALMDTPGEHVGVIIRYDD
ncbi:MAG TPA: zinc-binding alcohol dehydrogenase [Chthonomonadaceae bacterium]|nr:zinc-binding alcohol dehydrogenase [Chthonomonadaceae bacterium]